MIVKIAEGSLRTKFGMYQEVLYYDGKQEIIALTMGDITDVDGVLCRVHSSCIHADHFNSIECDCREQMEISQQLIQQEGRGVIIWLNQEGKSNGHFALLQSKVLEKRGMTQTQAYEAIGFKGDARDFARPAEILQDLKVKSIRMLTNNPKKIDTLTQYGVQVLGVLPITMAAGDNPEWQKTLDGKKQDGHMLK